ncbi:MAG: hypothetical protein ACXVFQ_20165, partial [Solirubrobacteraceae bacterium]
CTNEKNAEYCKLLKTKCEQKIKSKEVVSSAAPAENSTPLGAVHLVTFNADGQAQHIAAQYRPLSSVMFFSRLLRERFADTPYAEHFLSGEAEQT